MSHATTPDPLEYYARPAQMTALRDQADMLAGLPDDLPGLCRAVQNNLIHVFWAERYGVMLTDERKQTLQVRSVARKLALIRAEDPRPLRAARVPEARQVGNCRDFTLLLCACLRHRGVPARARCGFGTYFLEGHYEDHWVCEYWRPDERRWALVDAQLDDLQRGVLHIDFDVYDVPRDRFLIGGRAWQLCRAGQADPERFGIFDMHGMWFIRGNLLRDLAALNNTELLPWDCWGLVLGDEAKLTAGDLALLDRAAALTLADNAAFGEMRALYEGDARLRVPPVITSFPGPEPVSVDLEMR